MKSHHTKNTHLQAGQGNRTDQSLQKSIFSPTQEKLKNKKFPLLQKNKTSQPHSPKLTQTSIEWWTALKKVYRNLTRHRFGQTEAHAGNSGFKKLAVQWLNQVQFSNQTFVLVDSFVLRNRQLLKPANRWTEMAASPVVLLRKPLLWLATKTRPA
jgi:hypothetical protein